MGKGNQPQKNVKAKALSAKVVPEGFQKMASKSSKEPASHKQREKHATILGLRKLGAPGVGPSEHPLVIVPHEKKTHVAYGNTSFKQVNIALVFL